LRVLLVDGYNIIHAWPSLAAVLERKLEDARDALVTSLAPLADLEAFQVVVVFDAAAAGRPSLQVEEDRGLKVMYTGKGQTADALIEELVRRLAGKFEVSVATGDRAERDVAWFHGAAVWSAEALAREVEAARAEIEEESGRLRDGQRAPRLEERVPEEVRLFLDELRFE
jgi:predicted RNA-binding protein with PIN domain